MKELLIPYNKQNIVQKDPQDVSELDPQKKEQEKHKVMIKYFADLMLNIDRTFNQNLAKINKKLAQNNMKNGKVRKEQAKFYLENNKWKVDDALKQYKLDLRGQTVFELYKYNKQTG